MLHVYRVYNSQQRNINLHEIHESFLPSCFMGLLAWVRYHRTRKLFSSPFKIYIKHLTQILNDITHNISDVHGTIYRLRHTHTHTEHSSNADAFHFIDEYNDFPVLFIFIGVLSVRKIKTRTFPQKRK